MAQPNSVPTTQQSLPFRPLEYWKPPKAVRHIRKKSSDLLNSALRGSTARRDLGIEGFKKLGQEEMAFGRKNYAADSVRMTDEYGQPTGPPPTYKLDRDDTLNYPWYSVKSWGKKAWIISAVIVAIIIAIVVVIAVEVTKKNKYPDYSKLNYSLADTYSGKSFFDDFDYFTGYDPTAGFVHYVPAAQATSLNLTTASSTSAILRVDTSVTADSVPNASTGRFSVRISSKKQYGLNSLFVFNILHTPTGCGTWPALWLTDPSVWPKNGEIDVMEAVNVVGSTNNQMALHTTSGCSMGVKRKETGKSLTTSCVNTTGDNAGCGVDASTDKSTFGNAFNTAGGGYVAMELRSAGIRIWQWARSAVPSDISSGSTPDPSTWGEATADFPNTDCDIGSHFKNQSIMANIDLCGSWAGTQSIYGASCPGKCTDFVANNATAFTDAYWEFGTFSVYSAA